MRKCKNHDWHCTDSRNREHGRFRMYRCSVCGVKRKTVEIILQETFHKRGRLPDFSAHNLRALVISQLTDKQIAGIANLFDLVSDE